MKKELSVIIKFICLAAIFALGVFSIIASGGGGGGGGSTGITYTGVTTQAVIDEDNAYDIAVESYTGGDIASDLNVFGAVSENTGSVIVPLSFNISTYFQSVIYQIETATGQNDTYVGAVQSESDTIAGSCGGNFSYSVSGNDQTGDFNGSLTFNNYCEPGFTANGHMNLSGNVNLNTDEFNYVEMTFTNIVMASGGESISMSGTIDFNLQSFPMRMSMSFVFKDNNSNQTYKYENFVYEYTEGAGFVDMTLSGRFYHHDYGYVTLSTGSPLRIYGNDLWPSSGSVIATGDLGTKARLRINDSSSFIVEADTDGDGSYDDYSSGAILWSSL